MHVLLLLLLLPICFMLRSTGGSPLQHFTYIPTTAGSPFSTPSFVLELLVALPAKLRRSPSPAPPSRALVSKNINTQHYNDIKLILPQLYPSAARNRGAGPSQRERQHRQAGRLGGAPPAAEGLQRQRPIAEAGGARASRLGERDRAGHDGHHQEREKSGACRTLRLHCPFCSMICHLVGFPLLTRLC